MAKRKSVSDPVQAEVLVNSRRRCCVCFGLHRDDDVKQGQIAHLDKNPENNDEANLAFLCFNHHDTFDSKTSQSKNLTKAEVEQYREELYRHFSPWRRVARSEGLLNYLAASIDTEDIARTLLKVGHEVTVTPDFAINMALTEDEVELMDGDLAIPLLHVLDRLASWEMLTFEFEEPDQENPYFRFKITHENPEADKRLLEAVKKLEPWPQDPTS